MNAQRIPARSWGIRWEVPHGNLIPKNKNKVKVINSYGSLM